MFLDSSLSIWYLLCYLCFPACLHLLLSPGIAQQSSLGASLVSFWKNVFDSKLWCKQGFADFIYAEPYFWMLGPCLLCPNTVEFSLRGNLYCWLIASTQNRFMFTKGKKKNNHHPFLSYFPLVILDLLFLQNTSYLLEQAAAHRPHRSSLWTGWFRHSFSLNCSQLVQLRDNSKGL